MASSKVKYVGQKVSKVRWTPAGHLTTSKTFISGGWDNPVTKLSLWSIENIGNNGQIFSPQEPYLITEIEHEGDVTDIKYLDPEQLLTSSSNGGVTLHKYDSQIKKLSVSHSWSNLHHQNDSSSCSCTCLATNPNLPDFVSAGEDGRIIVLRLDQRKPVRNIDSADSTTISGITFVKSYEIVTVNCIGQLKLWDLRQNGNKPERVMLLSGDRAPLFCVDKHPTQPHLIATGGQDGVLALWDMRQERYPVALLEAHSAEVWEVMFHKSNPDHLFTCSQDGSVWQWNSSSINTPAMDISRILNPTLGITQNGTTNGDTTHDDHGNTTTPWFSADVGRDRIETFSLLANNRLPVNSVDVHDCHLVCGTDAESVCVLENLELG